MRTTAPTVTAATTATDADTFMDPDDDPTVRDARAAFDEALQREAEADGRRRRCSALVNPYQDNPPAELSDDRLQAIEHARDVMAEAARASRERICAEATWRAARERAREAVRCASRHRVRELVKRLAGLLDQAAAVNQELAVVEDRQRTLTGDWHLGGLAWPELSDGSPLLGSRLADWKRAVVEEHLLDG